MGISGETEKIFYNSVWKTVGCNHREISKLKSVTGTWEEVFRKLSFSKNAADPEAEWEKLEKSGIRLIFADEPDFPVLLREIYWPPYGIYLRGSLEFLKNKNVAVVGTRKVTEDGTEIARKFGRDFAMAGISVISGLAFGVDSAAHKGCIAAEGLTVAVLACGLDDIYPKSNERLANEILSAGGALISEYPPGTPPLPHRFIERNRIVSGLSLGVVVVEAPESSGSLATARFATEQNREVFVVPGPAEHRNFSGSHWLIRKGARLVSSVPDVLEDLNIVEPVESSRGEAEEIILKIVKNSKEPLGIDEIAEITNLESKLVSQTLTLLLLKNLVREKGVGFVIS